MTDAHSHSHAHPHHGHRHGAGAHPVHLPVMAGSLLRWSLAQRLGLAIVLSAALWAAVLAAMR